MSVVGFSAYAVGILSLTNNTTNDMSAICLPSGHYCNGVAPGSKTCTCNSFDTVMYFGRVGMPQDETKYLIPHTTFTAMFFYEAATGLHHLGNGNVWKLERNMNDSGPHTQTCTASGFPTDAVACDFVI